MRIAANAYGEYEGRFWHNDTTTMSLQREYKHEEGDMDAAPIEITYGLDKGLLRITEERGNASTKAPLFHISFFFMLNQDKRRIIYTYERECMVDLI